MHKLLLASAVAGALGAAGVAQAATVYDQDGTRMDIYGRIAMGLEGGGPEHDGARGTNNDAEFIDASSRLGVRLSHEVTSDLTAFGHLEWRFRADGGDNRLDAFHETRQSYLGLRSDTYGTFQAGNFDSFYFQAVTKPFDVYVMEGFEFSNHSTQSRGDSIGYISPKLAGFQAYLQAKHYSDRGELEETSRDTKVATQGGVVYAIDRLRLAAGWTEDIVRGGGNGENRYGASATYEFIPGLSARLGYETQDDDAQRGGGFDRWGVGGTFEVAEWTFFADIYDIDPDNGESRTSWALGTLYDVSGSFDVFLELHQADETDLVVDGSTYSGDDLYWTVGARYHF